MEIHPKNKIPTDILDDLASRFIINVPVAERSNLIRICFQIELAHWFYLDFFCEQNKDKLTPCGVKQFALHLFQHIPFLRNDLANIDRILEDWKQYKLSVPTYGAILLSEDLKHVLLVQSFWSKCSWGFPKGKVNENEDPIHCATREVYEETGYDITKLIVANEYIELIVNFQFTRLYIVRNVPIGTRFEPKTRCEIKCCEWFLLEHLPSSKHDELPKINLGMNTNSFFMVLPFIKRLKKWLSDITNQTISNSVTTRNLNISNFNYDKSTYFSSSNTPASNSRRQRHKSMGDIIEHNPAQPHNGGANNKVMGQAGPSTSSVNYKDSKKQNRLNGNAGSGNFASAKSAFSSTSTPIHNGNNTNGKSQSGNYQKDFNSSNNKQMHQQRTGNTSNNTKRKLFNDNNNISILSRQSNSPYVIAEQQKNERKMEYLNKVQSFPLEKTVKSMTWGDFKFNKNAILKAGNII